MEEAAVFAPCVQQVIFGFFSVTDDDGAKHHKAKHNNFFQGTRKQFYGFHIENFSYPGAIILDLTDCQGKQTPCY